VKTEMSEFFVGLGFSRLSKRRKKILYSLFVASLICHVVGLLIFGGWIVMRSRQEEKPVFVAPPPIKTYDPRKLEHRVKVQKRQRSSNRPSMVPRLISMKPSKLALPNIQLDPKVIKTSFQPKFKAVSGKGLGVGLGTGYGLGGFGGGVSSFNFFGIRGRGDKIVILMDVSVSMVEDDRGGVSGFLRVKNRISQVVEALDEAALFNVVAFADAARTWQPAMVIANENNRKEAKRWLHAFNMAGNFGLESGNVSSMDVGMKAIDGTTRLDIALSAAFQNGADTILIISDGLPRVETAVDPKKLEDYNNKLRKWREKNAKALANTTGVEKKVWVPGHDGKTREGGPKGPARKGEWVIRRVRKLPRGRPKEPEPSYWSLQDFLTYLEQLQDKVHDKKGSKPPVIHCIGYQIDSDGGRFLKRIAHSYKGRYRRVARIR